MEEDGTGGGFMSRKVMGIPMPILVIGAALIAYFLFFRNSGGGSQGQLNTTGNTGTDTLSTGSTTVDTGAISVTVNAGQPGAKAPDKKGKGNSLVSIPKVIGMTDTKADAALKKAGFEVHDVNEPKGGFGKAKAVVKAESPTGKAKKGSVIDLTFTTSANPTRKGGGGGGDSGEG